MKYTNIKGALLEYIVRNILLNCWFKKVKADDFYMYERGALFYVHWKWAAHDADVIVDPPIQFPFSYPTRIIFECKAYSKTTWLPIVRNALWLRDDINNFEIITENDLIARKNNRRKYLAIKIRNRFNFQVGVASINSFSKPALEFCINNKIPTICLENLFSSNLISRINSLSDATLSELDEESKKSLFNFLKDDTSLSINFENYKNVLKEIKDWIDKEIKKIYVWVLSSWDMIFLKTELEESEFNIDQKFEFTLHYEDAEKQYWRMKIRDKDTFSFYVPENIFSAWREHNLSKSEWLDIKRNNFSEVIIFNKEYSDNIFSVGRINNQWLDRIDTSDE